MKPVNLYQQTGQQSLLKEISTNQNHTSATASTHCQLRLNTIDSESQSLNLSTSYTKTKLIISTLQADELECKADKTLSQQNQVMDTSELLMHCLQQEYLASLSRFKGSSNTIEPLYGSQGTQKQFTKAQNHNRYHLDLSEINHHSDCDVSLKISVSDREIEHLQSIVEQIKGESEPTVHEFGTNFAQIDFCKQQIPKAKGIEQDVKARTSSRQIPPLMNSKKRSMSNVKKTTDSQLDEYCERILQKDQEIIKMKEQLFIAEQNERRARQELEGYRRINYELCKKNTQLSEEIDRLQKMCESLSTSSHVAMRISNDNVLKDRLSNPVSETPRSALKQENLKTGCKKYDSVVLRLTDENRQLKEIVVELTEQNCGLSNQYKLQEFKLQSVTNEAKTLRRAVETFLRKPFAHLPEVKPSLSIPANPEKVTQIRSELRALSTKLNQLNSRATPTATG